MENVADAVFLDLPSPWKALASAKAALKKEGGRICSFSPCIEQVQKTVLEMTQLGFVDIYTCESLRRCLSVKKYAQQDFDFNIDNQKNEENSNNNNNNKKRKNQDNNNSDDDLDGDNFDGNSSLFTAKAINLQPGHTGFLTFATLLHKNFQQI